MALPITFNNVQYQAGFFGTDNGGAPTNAAHSFQLDNTYNFPVTVNGTVTSSSSTVTITYTVPGAAAATTQTLTATPYDNNNMILFIGQNGVPGTEDGTINRFVFSNVPVFGAGAPNRTTFADDGNQMVGNYTATSPVCFASGTHILTVKDGAHCETRVEDLRVGDFAVTATGEARSIIWIGNRTIECARHPRANEVLPVRIAAHAFADNSPVRDLVVSPGHSIAVDLLGEVLIPASSLVNGTTVRQESVDRVTYWHVELESHDLLMAENLASESYMDMGNRGFFPRAADAVGLHAAPDAALYTHADFCRPFHANGSVVDFVRDRLTARALQLNWILTEHPLADLHIVVDGRRLEPEVQGLIARFLVPASAETVWLASDTAVPAMAGGGSDLRNLGVCVGRIVVDDGFGAQQVVDADDPRLCLGFHHVEEGPQRWTAGRARLPSGLWEGTCGAFFLRVELTRPALPRWLKDNACTEKRVAQVG